MCGFSVYLLYLQVNLAQIVCKLIFSTLYIRIYFFDFWWNFWIGILKLNQWMLCHLSTHMITKDLTIYAKSLTTYTTIKFKLYRLMLIAMSKFFRLFTYIYSIMLWGKFRSMVILLTFRAEMSIFSNAVYFRWFRRCLCTIIAKRSLRLLLLVCIDHIVNDIDGKDLIVLENHVLMLEDLWVLLFIIEIDRFKSIGTWDGIIKKFALVIAVWFSHRNLVHDTAHLLFCVFYLVEAHIEYHAHIWKLISFLAHFEDLIALV